MNRIALVAATLLLAVPAFADGPAAPAKPPTPRPCTASPRCR